jgi:hypothetical protein
LRLNLNGLLTLKTEIKEVMDRVYKSMRGKIIRFKGYEGIVCGYSDGRYLAATETKPMCSFRKVDKGTTIEEDYKDSRYRYFYFNEADFSKQKKKV